MTDHENSSALDHASYSRFPGLKFLAFLAIFFVSGIAVIIKFDSYFTDFVKIADCKPDGYERGQFMTACSGIKVDRYSFGAPYLGVQKNLYKNAQNADVIIFGNSRTQRSFSTDAIDNYFKSKGLTYVILASEGAGYKSALLTTENMNLKPKIVMFNTEILYSDEISDAFSDIVYFPDKYKTRYEFFHTAQTIHKSICTRDIPNVSEKYCSGTKNAAWRSAVNGRNEWDLEVPLAEQELITPGPDRSRMLSSLVPRAVELINHRNFKNSCPILYIVNSPNSAPKLQENLASEMGVQSVFKRMNGLYTYDKSHLDRPMSEKWAEQFVTELDPAIDNCLSGNGRVEKEVIDFDNLQVAGDTDFETWLNRQGVIVENNGIESPKSGEMADSLIYPEKPARIQKIYRDREISAGDSVKFGIWLWSEEYMRVRIQIVRSCSADTPMEAFNQDIAVTPTPTLYEVGGTFEHDHKCALTQIFAYTPNVPIYAWKGNMSFSSDSTVEN